MPDPENVSSLQSFLSLANDYNVFVPNLHNLQAPLNEQLIKRKEWAWTAVSESIWENLKSPHIEFIPNPLQPKTGDYWG